ncbi:MAG: hypothetical protein NT166_15650 [Candidatus Aminicenantes bacterium]|nr:hypothetical protein [Candidatus Aminicenantes bacterium]
MVLTEDSVVMMELNSKTLKKVIGLQIVKLMPLGKIAGETSGSGPTKGEEVVSLLIKHPIIPSEPFLMDAVFIPWQKMKLGKCGSEPPRDLAVLTEKQPCIFSLRITLIQVQSFLSRSKNRNYGWEPTKVSIALRTKI